MILYSKVNKFFQKLINGVISLNLIFLNVAILLEVNKNCNYTYKITS